MSKVARFQLADGRVARFEVPDEATPEQAQMMMSDYFSGTQTFPEPQQPTQPQEKEYAGFSGSFMDSATQLGLADEAAAYMADPTKENRDKLLAAGESKYKTVGFGEGHNWEALKELVGGSLGSLVAPVAAGIPTGLVGAVGAAGTQYTIGAAQRAAERQRTQEEAGEEVEDISQAKILAAAAGETALDYMGLKFFKGVGRAIPGKLGEQVGEKLAKVGTEDGLKVLEDSIKNGTYSLKDEVMRGVGRGIAFEAPQEIAQQALERFGAGLDLTSPDAISEYIQAGVGAGILGGPMGAIDTGLDIRRAKQNVADEKAAAEKPVKYMDRVNTLVNDGFDVQAAEKIVTTAEQMESDFDMDPREAIAAARKQWEIDNEKPVDETNLEQDHERASGEPVDTGAGAGISVPSGEITAETTVGKPEELRTDGLVPPDTSVGLPGGGTGSVETALEVPEIIPPEETKLEQPEPTIEETKVEEPAVEPTVEETKIEEPKLEETKIEEPKLEEIKAEPVTTYTAAVEAVNQLSENPERLVTPAYIANAVDVSIPEAKIVLEQLHTEGVVGEKRGVSGYVQATEAPKVPEVPAAPEVKLPEPPAAPKIDMAARKADLLSKIETAFEDDVITEDQYRDFKFAVTKDRGLPNRALKLIGAEDLVEPAVAAAPEIKPAPKVEETVAEPVAETKAQRDLTDDEFKTAHTLLNRGENLTPELLDVLGVDPKQLPTTRVDQNTGKINIHGMSKQETTVALRDRLEEVHKTLGLSKTAYNNIARAINSGKELSEGALDVLGVTKTLSPTEARTKYLREVLNSKQRQQDTARTEEDEAWLSGDRGEEGIQKAADAKARYTTNVLQMAAKLLEFGKISRYEHAGIVNEITKENPNRNTVAKLLANFSTRKETEKPTTLLKGVDVGDAAELILKRLDAKRAIGTKPIVRESRIFGAGLPSYIERAGARRTKAKEVYDDLKASAEEWNAPNNAVMGPSDEHHSWAEDAFNDEAMHDPAIGDHLIYSDNSKAVFVSNVGGLRYGLIDRLNGKITKGLSDTFTDPSRRNKFGLDDQRASFIGSAITAYKMTERKLEEAHPNGPFVGKEAQIVHSHTVDPRYAELTNALLENLNIKGIRLFLFHPEDIAGEGKHAYGLYGKHTAHLATAMSATTQGVKAVIGNNKKDFAIGLRSGMSDRLTIEVLTHEIGHLIEDVALKTAPVEVQKAIKAEYDAWYKKSKKMTPMEVLYSLKLPQELKDAESFGTSPEAHVKGEIIGTHEYDSYVREFEEWWADNVARWMNTSAKPISIVDKFFKSVADQLRKLIQTVTGKTFVPAKTVAAFLEDMQTGRRDFAKDFLEDKFVKVPEELEFDISDIFSTGSDYNYSKKIPGARSAVSAANAANVKIANAEEKFRASMDATNHTSAIEEAIKARDPAKLKEATNIYLDGLKGDALDNALSFMPTSWIIERIEKILPSVAQAQSLQDLLEGSKDRLTRAFSKVSTELEQFIATNGQEKLAKMISDARNLQVSASEWTKDTTVKDAIDADDEVKAYKEKAAAAANIADRAKYEAKLEERAAIVSHVFDSWTALSEQEGGHAMYMRLMNFYRNAHTMVRNLLSKDIDFIPGLTDEQRTALKKEAEESFDATSRGGIDEDGIFRRATVESYFPWRRFGEYWLRVAPQNDGQGAFYTFDSAAELEANRRKIAAKLGVSHNDGNVFEYGNDIQKLRDSMYKHNDSQVLRKMLGVLEDAKGGKGINLTKLKDEMTQLWLLTLPERSVRRQWLHSGDVTGMSFDLLRVFKDTAKVYASQIPKLQYGNRIRQQMEAAREAIAKTEKSEYNLNANERARLTTHIDTIDSRMEDSISPPPRSKVISAANHFTHLWFLSAPSHGLRNMITVAMRTMPALNSQYGYAASFAKSMKYLNLFNSFKLEHGGKLVSPSIGDSDLLRNNKVLADLFRMGRDRRAFSGVGYEVIKDDGPSKNKSGKVFRALYNAGTAIFDASERISREMAFMMQAELAYEKHRAAGKSEEQAKQLAVDEAVRGVKSAIGDFSELERPDFMRTKGMFGESARAVFMFKMWAVAQTKFFMTYANKIFVGKGLTGKERFQALHEMAGVLAMAALMGGTAGLPLYSVVCFMIDAWDKYITDDDDELKKQRLKMNPLLADSSDARFRYIWLPQHFGQIKVPGIDGKERSLAQVIAQGPVSALTGVDIGAKTTYDNLWFRNPTYSPSAQGAAASFILENLGPDVSIAVDAFEAADNFEKGRILRGVSNLVPSIGKGFIASYRAQTEGATTAKGIPIVKAEDINSLARLSIATGLPATAMTDAYNRMMIVSSALKRMETEKSNLKERFIQAVINHRDMQPIIADMRKFNARYPQPQFMLTPEQLLSSVSTYQKTYESSLYGARMPKPEDWIYATWYGKDRYK